MNKEENSYDRLYFNIVMPYKPVGGLSPAIYRQELSEPLIMNPSEYYIAITRFTIPTSNIPIFIAEIQPFPNVNLNNTVYSVTLTYGAFSSGQTFIQYVTHDINSPQSLPLTASHPYADKTPYYYIYTYTDFLDMINAALITALTTLKGLVGAPIALATAPYFIYDTTTEKISLIADSTFYDLILATPIKFYVNYKLFSFLDGFPTFFYGNNLPNGLDFQFEIHQLGNNWYPIPNVAVPLPSTLLSLTQQYNTLSDWNSFKSLQLVTNLLPVVQEYTPQVGNQSDVNLVGILKDFEPIIELGPEGRTTVQYQINSPYQLINLIGKVPLTKVDIQIYWTDQFGNQYLLDIPYNQIVTIKLVFIKKSTFTS